jgi:hypothetical protein
MVVGGFVVEPLEIGVLIVGLVEVVGVAVALLALEVLVLVLDVAADESVEDVTGPVAIWLRTRRRPLPVRRSSGCSRWTRRS